MEDKAQERSARLSLSALSGCLVFVAALAARLGYLSQIDRSPYYHIGHMMGTSDPYRFFKWALTLASGDWLMSGTYYQAPLYPYLLGVQFYLLGTGHLLVPRFLQALMGSVTALLVFFIARRMKGNAAGVAGGLIAAFYGPLIFFDLAILRTSLLCLLFTLTVLSMMRSQERPGPLGGAGTGLVFALGILAKPTILAMLPALPWWLYESARQSGRRRTAVMAAAGIAAALAVMALPAARNIAVGAPPLKLTARGPVELIAGNHPEAPVFSWQPTPEIMEMAAESRGSLARASFEILAYYRRDPAALIKRQVQKTGAFLAGYEVPSNVNYYIEKRYVPFLDKPWINWPAALGLGLIGGWAVRKKFRKLLAPCSYLVLYSLGVVAFYMLARFRIPVAPVLCAFAGAGAVYIVEEIRAKRPAGFIAAAVATAVALAAWPRPDDPVQPQDYRNIALYHVKKGQAEKARALVREGMEKARGLVRERGDAWSHYRLARLMYLGGYPLDEVQEEIEKARAAGPPGWASSLLGILEAKCRARSQEDEKVSGFRFR